MDEFAQPKNPIAQKLRSAEGAHALPRQYVASEEIYDLESVKIFSNHWICVARTDELHHKSRCLPIQVEQQEIFLAQDEPGIVHAFRNFCRHRGSRLVGQENCATLGQRIQCPYHAWTYDRSGALLSAPNMADVDDFRLDQYGLLEIPCQTIAGFIWINFAPQQDLATWLALLRDRFAKWNVAELRIAHEINYEVAANWKLIFQNYSECYHCPIVHPMLNRLTPYRGSSNDFTTGPILGGPMGLSEQSQTMSIDGALAGKLLPGLSSEQSRTVQYFTIFPSLFLSLHPDYVLIHRVHRIDIAHSKIVCQFLFHPDSIGQIGFDPGNAIEFWDVTNRQDWHVCELAQAGMSDPAYVPGPYSNLESVVAAFDRNYLQAMASVV